VLEVNDPEKFEMRRNGDWFAEMNFFKVVGLTSRMTVARLLERNDFSKRYRAQTPIYLHEMLYPIMQGWDSVVVKADVELGGTDQKYNLLVGRDFQRAEKQEPQVCLTVPLLVGTDGTRKMSKSYDNYIGITEPAKTMFDKILSIPDSLMRDYFILLTDVPITEADRLIATDPREAKLRLANKILAIYHPAMYREEMQALVNLPTPVANVLEEVVSISEALKNANNLAMDPFFAAIEEIQKNVERWHNVMRNATKLSTSPITAIIEEMQKRIEAYHTVVRNATKLSTSPITTIREEMQKIMSKWDDTLTRFSKLRKVADFKQKAVVLPSDLKDGKIWIVKLVRATGFVKSNSEARRKILEGAVSLNGKKITDPDTDIEVEEGQLLWVGKKRLARITLRQGE
jgi:tyrosyl-tRNA synthetase